MNLKPEEIPDKDVREWYLQQNNELFSLPVVKEAEIAPSVVSLSVFSRIGQRNIIPSNISPDGYVFYQDRLRHFKCPRSTFDGWQANRFLAIKERNERSIKLTCKPIYVDVELNNICNLKCKFCTSVHGHVPNVTSHEARLTTGEIDLLQKLCVNAEVIETSKGGEPFLTPDLFVYFLKKVREVNPFVLVHAVSNGTILTPSLLESLVHLKLDHMYVSISGHDRESYKQVMQGDLFDKVIQNLNKIQQAKEKFSSNEPYMHFNCQLSKFGDPFKLLEIAKEFGVIEVNFIKTQMSEGNQERFSGCSVQEYMSHDEVEQLMDDIVDKANELRIAINFSGWDTRPRKVVGSGVSFYYPHETKYFDLSLTCPTDAPWFRYCTVMRKVQPCCWSGGFADWTKESFEDIWNGEYLCGMRTQMARGEYPAACHCRY